jgi:hypothetical protein
MKATAKSDLESGRGRGAAFVLVMLSIGVGLCLRDRIGTASLVTAGLFLALSFPPRQEQRAAQTDETRCRWRVTMRWLGCGIAAAYLLSVYMMAAVGQHSFLM